MVNERDFIRLPISRDLQEYAYKLAYADKKNYNEQTIKKDNSGRYAGFIGELSLIKYLKEEGIEYEWQNENSLVPSYDFDLIVGKGKIDVKTKDRTVDPKTFYECSIAEYSVKQDCDYYIFNSLTKNKNLKNVYTTNHILGFISKKEYIEKAYFRHKGEIDPNNGFTTPKSCYNLKISELYPLSTLFAVLLL